MVELKGLSKSKVNKITSLIQIHKGLIKRKQTLTDFKEPVVWLIRRSFNMEFFEKQVSSHFTFIHSDGETRKIELTPSRMISMDYGNRKVRTYILFEDSPLPIPEDPIVTTELLAISQEKSMHDLNKFKLKEAKIKSGAMFKIFLGAAIVAIAIALAVMLIPQSFWEKVFAKKPVETTETLRCLLPMIPICFRNRER